MANRLEAGDFATKSTDELRGEWLSIGTDLGRCGRFFARIGLATTSEAARWNAWRILDAAPTKFTLILEDTVKVIGIILVSMGIAAFVLT